MLTWIRHHDLRSLAKIVSYSGSYKQLDHALRTLCDEGRAPASLVPWLLRVLVHRWTLETEREGLTRRYARREGSLFSVKLIPPSTV